MNALLRALGWTLALGLVALPLVALLNGWFAADRWPVQRLSLSAPFERVSADQIRTTVAPHAGAGFFALELAPIREAVSALPWVEAVEVRKRWPDTLEIVVREHRAVARWGDDRLLSDHGLLFAAPGADAMQDLPRLGGPESRIEEVVAVYRGARERLAAAGLGLVGATVDARGSWHLALDSGAEIDVGRAEQPLARIDRFVAVAPRLLARERRAPARVDLRYTNGFAVAWAAPVETLHPESG